MSALSEGSKKALFGAGLVVTVMALSPLGGLLSQKPEGASSTTSTAPVSQEALIYETAPPRIDEVDRRISNVLYAFGSADAITSGDLDQLPSAIVRVLAYYDVTLAVPTDVQP